MNKRKEIREALKELLSSIDDIEVYSNRTESYFVNELPAISIVTGEESLTRRDISSKSFIRDLEVSIIVHQEAKKELDDYLEDKIEEIEELLLSNQSLGVSGVIAMEILSNRIELEDSIGVAYVVFKIKYVR